MLFQGITLLRADGTCLTDMSVGVRGKTIAYVGRDIPTGEWGEVVDGKNRVLMPGLVNAHTHVAMTLMRGYGDDMPLDRWLYDRIFPFEDKLTAEDVYWGSMLGIAEMLASGTTSFTDMYYFCDETVKAVTESGIKANIGRGISCFDPSKRFRDLPAYHELVDLLDHAQGAADGRVRIDVAPHSEYTTRPDILADAAKLAVDKGARLHVHLSETRKEHLECTGRYGKTPARVMEEAGLFELPVTAAHCVWLTDSDIELLAAHDVTVAHNPQSNLKLASGIAQVEKMRRMGIPVALGTDSAASNNNLDMFEEMRTAALLAKGVSLDPCALPAGEVLNMATRQGALSQGRSDCGDIAEGLCADLVMLNLHRLSMTPCHNVLSNVLYAAGSGELELTMVDGKVLYRDGQFTTMDIERIEYHTNRCVQALLAR